MKASELLTEEAALLSTRDWTIRNLICGSYFSERDETKLIQRPKHAEWNTACDDDDE